MKQNEAIFAVHCQAIEAINIFLVRNSKFLALTKPFCTAATKKKNDFMLEVAMCTVQTCKRMLK